MEVRFNDGWMNRPNHQWFLDRVNELMAPHRPMSGHDTPPADVIESEEGYHFYFEMPGVKTESISVKLEDGALTVEAESKRPEFSGQTTAHRSERHYPKFHRAFRLPE